ncbi:MAG: hypothetical protein M3065_00460 [Actinomycetota bacterium]|nr:hypothetical protein [Actinomycetota bacterium]
MIVVGDAALIDALIAAPGSEQLRARLAGEELHVPSLHSPRLSSAHS